MSSNPFKNHYENLDNGLKRAVRNRIMFYCEIHNTKTFRKYMNENYWSPVQKILISIICCKKVDEIFPEFEHRAKEIEEMLEQDLSTRRWVEDKAI